MVFQNRKESPHPKLQELLQLEARPTSKQGIC